MFVGAKFTKWVNEKESPGLFYVLKKTTMVGHGYDNINGEYWSVECDFDIYDDAHIYVSSCQIDIDFMDLYIKSNKESCILMEEEDIIVSCERLWMH